jgi:hypothetical protein
LWVVALAGQAANYQAHGPFINPQAGSGIPSPGAVPGKEFADNANKSDSGGAVAGQSVYWDGVGGTTNSLLYGSEIDSLANANDALSPELLTNTAALILGIQGTPNVYFESIGGGVGTWASQPSVDGLGVNEIMGLEVWGPELASDANRFSLRGDPSGCAIFAFPAAFPASSCVATTLDIADAIGLSRTEVIDLDALMVNQGTFIFSIRPSGNLDGGEIWVWTPGSAAAFLNHGGHVWDTAFDVRRTFGTGSENVQDIEAIASPVPEPGTIGLTLAGGLAVLLARRMRR